MIKQIEGILLFGTFLAKYTRMIKKVNIRNYGGGEVSIKKKPLKSHLS